jgi:hypothetical protein
MVPIDEAGIAVRRRRLRIQHCAESLRETDRAYIVAIYVGDERRQTAFVERPLSCRDSRLMGISPALETLEQQPAQLDFRVVNRPMHRDFADKRAGCCLLDSPTAETQDIPLPDAVHETIPDLPRQKPTADESRPIGFVKRHKMLKILQPVGPQDEIVGLDQWGEQCSSLFLSTCAVQGFDQAADDGVISLQL